MARKTQETGKQVAVVKWEDSKKFFMADGEYVGVVVGKDKTDGEYVISDGVIAPGSQVPDHYHLWEDQTFHIIEGTVKVKIGEQWQTAGVGDTIHCPRGVSHFMKNIGAGPVRVVSYIFPGHWAEDFFAETSRQNQTGERDLKLIEEKFGVIYL